MNYIKSNCTLGGVYWGGNQYIVENKPTLTKMSIYEIIDDIYSYSERNNQKFIDPFFVKWIFRHIQKSSL